MNAKQLPFLFLGVVLLSAVAWADDWTQFRGPNGNGVSTETQLPAEWSTSKNVQWKLKLTGHGWSCPVVLGDKVFLTTAVADKQKKPTPGGGFGGGGFGGKPPGGGGFGGKMARPPDEVYRYEVQCLNRADGKVIWKQTAAERKPTIPTHSTNGYASETPVTDGERLYVCFGMTGLYCYDLEGKEIWKKDLGSHAMMAGWGTGSSPVLHDGRLFLQCDNEERSFLTAFDAKTGKELWRVNRDEKSSWGTPLVWKNKQRTELVAAGRKVRSYDPATGKVLWELGGLTGTVSSSPVATDELLFVGCGGMFGDRPLVAVKAGASGDITLRSGQTSNTGVAWQRAQAGPGMASPLVYNGFLYVLDQRGGFLTCYEAATGKPAYSRQRLPGARGFTSSPWAYEGKIFCLDEGGTTFVVQAGAEFKLLGENSIKEMCWSSPAISGGNLFLRGVDHLFCIK